MQHTMHRTTRVLARRCTITLLTILPSRLIPSLSCPFSLWERVRVRGFVPRAAGPLTPALSRREGELRERTVASGARSVKHRADPFAVTLTAPTKRATTRTSWGHAFAHVCSCPREPLLRLSWLLMPM